MGAFARREKPDSDIAGLQKRYCKNIRNTLAAVWLRKLWAHRRCQFFKSETFVARPWFFLLLPISGVVNNWEAWVRRRENVHKKKTFYDLEMPQLFSVMKYIPLHAICMPWEKRAGGLL
jgi:hypothetical protein